MIRRFFTLFTGSFFVITVVLNFVGMFFYPVIQFEQGQFLRGSVNNGIPGRHFTLRDTSLLYNAISTPKQEFDIEKSTALVFESLRSGDRKILIYENWLLWGLGKAYAPMGRTQSPKRIVAGGVAICSEAAEVLNEVASINGNASRFIGLQGHVISEIKVNQKWLLADADYGIVFPFGYNEMLRLSEDEVAQIISSLLTNRGFKTKVVEFYKDVLLSIEDNTVQKIGEKQSPRLWLIEYFANYFIWLISIISGLVCLFLLYSRGEKDKFCNKQ